MGLPEDVVTVDVGPDTFAWWEAYEIDSDLMVPADAFSVSGWLHGTYSERRAALARFAEGGLRVFVYVQRRREDGTLGPRALQMSGIVDKVAARAAREGATITITGRDAASLLVAASADPRLGVTAETTLVEMVRAVCEPYGLTVVTENAPSRTLLTGASGSRTREQLLVDHARSYGIPAGQMRAGLARRRSVEGETRSTPVDEASGAGSETRAARRARRGHGGGLTGSDIERLRLAEAKPGIGETIWDFIDRHCRRFGVMPWLDAQGRVVIASPDYDQEPLFQLRRYLDPTRAPGGNNILEGGFVQDWAALSSECTVYGRAFGSDQARSPFHATETNPNQPLYRPLTLHDPAVRSTEEAQRRARRELNRQNAEHFTLEYAVQAHGQGGLVWAIDTVVDVVDEALGVEGLFYVRGRTLSGDMKNGSRTRLRLVPLHAIEL